MSAIDQTITVAPVTPATPIVVCDSKFLTTLTSVEYEVVNLKVTDAATATVASGLLQRLTSAGSALEKARAALKAPFIAKGREIDEAAKAPAKRIEDAKDRLKRKVTEFQEAQRKAAEEAERQRLAEIKRLEEIARKEAEERARKAEEMAKQAAAAAEAAKAPVVDIDFGDDALPTAPPPKSEAEVALEKLKHAPAVVAEKPAGVAFKTRLIIASVDVAKLPEPFIVRTANEQLIRSTYCVGWKDGDPVPEVPGVAFKIDRQVASTGRTAF